MVLFLFFCFFLQVIYVRKLVFLIIAKATTHLWVQILNFTVYLYLDMDCHQCKLYIHLTQDQLSMVKCTLQ